MFHQRSLKSTLDRLDPKNFKRERSVTQLRKLDSSIDRQFLVVNREISRARMQKHQWFGDRGRRAAFTEEDGLWHMAEKDLLHRGEILRTLWQEDIEPLNTSDLVEIRDEPNETRVEALPIRNAEAPRPPNDYPRPVARKAETDPRG
jgi:hypothetical protein